MFCIRCNKNKENNQFNNNKKVCKECLSAYNKAYWKKNKEIINKKVNKIYRENRTVKEENWRVDLNGNKIVRDGLKYKYKKRKRKRTIGKYTKRFKILLRDNFTCQYCGRKVPEVILEVDHITPKSKKGNNSTDNLITSCRDCNRGKGDKLINSSKKIINF